MLEHIYRKDDVKIPISMTNNGVPIDLTGITLKFILKKDKEDSSPIILEKTIISHLNPAEGKSEIILTSSDTSITAGKYYCSIVMIDTMNSVSTLVVSDIEIRQGLR